MSDTKKTYEIAFRKLKQTLIVIQTKRNLKYNSISEDVQSIRNPLFFCARDQNHQTNVYHELLTAGAQD